MNPDRYARLKVLAESCEMSVSHFCDLLAGLVVEEGGEWLRRCMEQRLREGLRRARSRRAGSRRAGAEGLGWGQRGS